MKTGYTAVIHKNLATQVAWLHYSLCHLREQHYWSHTADDSRQADLGHGRCDSRVGGRGLLQAGVQGGGGVGWSEGGAGGSGGGAARRGGGAFSR